MKTSTIRICEGQVEDVLTAVLYDLLTCDPWRTRMSSDRRGMQHYHLRVTSPEGDAVDSTYAITTGPFGVRVHYDSTNPQGHFHGTVSLAPTGADRTRVAVSAHCEPSSMAYRVAEPVSKESFKAMIHGFGRRIQAVANLMSLTSASNLQRGAMNRARALAQQMLSDPGEMTLNERCIGTTAAAELYERSSDEQQRTAPRGGVLEA